MNERMYKIFNNAFGWLAFIIASTVYILTAEPTASFWDCGEFIATAYKLQVGHPPGAPTFQLIGRIFSMLALGDVTRVAWYINVMSALCSGFTIAFMFWSMTMLLRKLAKIGDTLIAKHKAIAIFGGAMVASLAYTFTDTFWFSAVEGEVYAMSSMFTALVFWMILKWEREADQRDSLRWLVLIAYMIGLSIGVHLLNLLTVPAIVMVYYFKKYENPTWRGGITAFLLSIVILGGTLYGIIPLVVKLAGGIEIFFVNSLGLPFNSGTIFYFALLIGGIIFGLYYTRKKLKPVLNTIILAFAFILIGYSSFFILIIRSNANTPIDENNPEDAVALLAYLNREQYGSYPLFHGQYYNAPAIKFEDGSPFYVRDTNAKKYIVSDDRKGTIPVYDKRYTTIFPRMWSNQQAHHATYYKDWAGIKGDPESRRIPTMRHNLKFFKDYQLGYMYMRYFMWNFVGRQNDTQGMGGILNGNWISGIKFIDEMRLGPQSNIPPSMQSKGRNTYFFLPLILGLIGLFYHFYKNSKDAIVLTLLFFMTGFAIAIYLNMYAYQPRERDYAFAASFYAFAMWIGVGTFAIYDGLRKKINPTFAASASFVATLFLVPVLMASQNWDDHDRSNRYTVLAIASNYLNSCAPNAIIFTNGDNDTFPLWYAQEVEGIRTDVRVCNLSLLNTDWYIDQMLRKAYESEPVPMQMTWDKYKQGTRDYMPVFAQGAEAQNIKDVVNTILDDSKMAIFSNNKRMNFVPTQKLYLEVDSAKVVSNGTVSPEEAEFIVDRIEWEIPVSIVQKNMIAMMDILANFNWDRPIYYASTTGNDAYFGLQDYFQLEGFAYRLVPIKTTKDPDDIFIGRVNTDVLYDNVMNKFTWGGLNDPRIYINEDNSRLTMTIKTIFGRLAEALEMEAHLLAEEGEVEKAMKLLDKATNVLDEAIALMPNHLLPYNYFNLPMAETYFAIANTIDSVDANAGTKAEKSRIKARDILEIMISNSQAELDYYLSFKAKFVHLVDREIQQNLGILQRISAIAEEFDDVEIFSKASDAFQEAYTPWVSRRGGYM
ncbi:MAG: DUF2723 domain-containing protein [Bacteroidales bacterium]